jgi:NAD(P)-dependent dehydrogenase (short-subunit alcohol dehydrogenase family)
MTQAAGKTVLITGANAGIGKEAARQLALRDDTARIYLACRNPGRARAAKAELEAATCRPIFDIVLMDVSDPESVRAALPAISGPLGALIMNAGGSGGGTPLTLTASGATRIFAVNVLGHVVLLDALLAEGRLTEVALYAGSEAARGVPKFRMRRPAFATTSADELATVIDGSYFEGRKPSPALAYSQAKYIAALWMASLARQHPEQRFITMSPGNTSGTGTLRDQPLPLRLAAKYVMPALGLSHSLETGAGRLVDGITDTAFRSGVFYASAVTGSVADQADIFPDLRNASFQDNANQAIHRFIPA